MKRHLIRLDRVAGELNAWLLAIAIGLTALDFNVLIGQMHATSAGSDGCCGAGSSRQTVSQF